MRSVVLRNVILIALAISPVYAAGLLGGRLPRIKLPDICEAKCGNGDGDQLFPNGTINASCVLTCRNVHLKSPPSPGVRPSGNNRAFILLEPMTYVVGTTGVQIIVPAGFVTDYASVPESLWSFYSPHDQYSRAAILHDYLYWSQLCTRAQADNLFMIAMKESEVPERTRNNVYAAVHHFGNSSWEGNQRQRKAKMPRIVPLARLDFPPNWSWEMYREYLVQQGVEDPPFLGDEYCTLGNTDAVPTGQEPPSKGAAPITATRALHGVDSERLRSGPGSYD